MFRKYHILIVLVLLTASCSKFTKLCKSSDLDLKYSKALEYYEEGDFYKSRILLEELKPMYIGTDRGMKIHWYFAQSYFKDYEFMMAAFQFKSFTRTYPSSDSLSESMFMMAYSLFRVSPQYYFDQYISRQAIEAFQLFIIRNPGNEKIDTANSFVELLRENLEIKAFERARLYFNREKYQAAIIDFNNNLEEFPDSEFREEIMYLIMKSYFLWAEGSIEEKKEERYTEMIKEYYTFANAYPESDFIKESQRMYKKAAKELGLVINEDEDKPEN